MGFSMKKTLLIFSLMCISLYVGAQDLNLRLYKAVNAKDTLEVEKLLTKGADANYKFKVARLK